MTDARYPERWLNDRRLLRLSDPGHRLYVLAMAWSVSNRTDGELHDDDLPLVPGVDPARAGELAKAGLWERHGDRWLIVDFLATQTTAAQLAGIEHRRAVDRERQARHRKTARSRAERPADQPEIATPVTRDTTRDVADEATRDGTRDTKARPGQARTGQEKDRRTNRERGREADPASHRPVGAAPSRTGEKLPAGGLGRRARELVERGYEH